MNIEKIFENVDYEIIKFVNNKYENIHYDSRKIKKNDIFVALVGTNVDGHNYITKAIENGASMIILERKDVEISENITVVYVKNLRYNLAQIASNFYKNPQDELKIIAITGTNGKTTTSYILDAILKNSSRIGTTGYKIGDKEYEAQNTTPESLDLIKLMRESVDKGIKYFVMEVSSHALSMGRVNNIYFDGAIFTNLTQDHLDYHKDMEEYFKAKASIVNHLKENVKLIINKDDIYASRIKENISTFSTKTNADISGKILEYNINGMKVEIYIENKRYIFETKLMGEYNLQNILASIQVSLSLGLDIDYIIETIKNLKAIPGRFEMIENDNDYMIIVDYAHTPDGLENILKTLQKMKKNKIITLFGAGGDRDKTKRDKMGKVAEKYSDFVYITSDNPRTENPIEIINDIEKGFSEKKYIKIIDREESIKKAIENLEKNDILLIAGKGHEDYQIIGITKYHFDDREVAKKYLGGK